MTAPTIEAPPATTPPTPPTSPYRGLRPFTEAEEDAVFFFGREEDGKINAANLLSARLTLVYGPSGVGKSSVLLAGVVNSLRKRARENLAEEGAAGFAVLVVRSWSDPDPLKVIAAAARDEVVGLLGRDDLEDPPDGATLAEVLDHWSTQIGGKMLVLFDQFEEYFLYHEDERGKDTFDGQFPLAVNQAKLRANFLVSIRDDSLARLDRFKGRIPNLFDNRLQIADLTREGAKDAVKRPIETYRGIQKGCGVPPDQQVDIEDDLVTAVLDGCADEGLSLATDTVGSGAQPATAAAGRTGLIKAPFLQLVLERLWRSAEAAGEHTLTLAQLDGLDGVKGIVKNHLRTALESLSPDEQDIAAGCFGLLVSPTKTKIAYPASVLTAVAGRGRSEEEVTAVLDKLCAAESGRILRAFEPAEDAGGHGSRSYELFHDLLAEPITTWRKEHEEERLYAEERRRRRAEFERRRKWITALVGLVLLFAALAVYGGLEQHWAHQATHRAQQATKTANDERVSAASVALASAADAQLAGHPDVALLLSLEAYHAKRTPQAEGSVLSALTAVRRSGAAHVLRGNQGGITAVAFGGTGNTLAAAGSDGTVKLWNSGKRTLGRELPKNRHGAVTAVALSPDKHTLGAGYSDGAVLLWDFQKPTKASENPHLMEDAVPGQGAVTGLAFDSGDEVTKGGDRVAAVDSDGSVRVWSTKNGKRVGQSLAGDDMQIGPDGERLFCITNHQKSATIAIWDWSRSGWRPHVSSAPNEKGPVKAPRKILAHAYHGQSSTFAAAYDDGTVQLWHMTAHHEGPTRLKAGPAGGINSLAFSSNGRALAAADSDGTVRLFDVNDLTLTRRGTSLNGHQGAPSSVEFSGNEATLAAGYDDGTVLLWPLRAPTAKRARGDLSGAFKLANAYSFSADGKAVAVVTTQDDKVQYWDTSSQKLLWSFSDDLQGLGMDIAFSPDGKMLATAGLDGTVRLWGVKNRKEVGRPLRVNGGGVAQVLFSPGGQTLLTGDFDGKLQLWDLRTKRRLLGPMVGHQGTILQVKFSPDGRQLAMVNSNGTVLLWDATTGKRLGKALYVSRNGVNAVAFSPDGKSLVTGGTNGTVLSWDIETGNRLPISDNQRSVNDVAFSPDGTSVASAGADGVVVLSNLNNHTRLRLDGNQGAVRIVAFNADGSLTAVGDRRTVTWKRQDLTMPADLKAQVCSLVAGNLTQRQWTALAPPGWPYRKICPG